MAFIMKKEINGHVYLYQYECTRIDGVPRNKFLKYLGRQDKAANPKDLGSISKAEKY